MDGQIKHSFTFGKERMLMNKVITTTDGEEWGEWEVARYFREGNILILRMRPHYNTQCSEALLVCFGTQFISLPFQFVTERVVISAHPNETKVRFEWKNIVHEVIAQSATYEERYAE